MQLDQVIKKLEGKTNKLKDAKEKNEELRRIAGELQEAVDNAATGETNSSAKEKAMEAKIGKLQQRLKVSENTGNKKALQAAQLDMHDIRRKLENVKNQMRSTTFTTGAFQISEKHLRTNGLGDCWTTVCTVSTGSILLRQSRSKMDSVLTVHT
eukprot:gene22271-1312_t